MTPDDERLLATARERILEARLELKLKLADGNRRLQELRGEIRVLRRARARRDAVWRMCTGAYLLSSVGLGVWLGTAMWILVVMFVCGAAMAIWGAVDFRRQRSIAIEGARLPSPALLTAEDLLQVDGEATRWRASVQAGTSRLEE